MEKQKFDQLVLKIKRAGSPVDLVRLEKALTAVLSAASACQALDVALLLADWLVDEDLLLAGLLYGLVENGQMSDQKLEKDFGVSVAKLVTGVTRVGNLKLPSQQQEVLVENLRKLIVAMAKDLRVVLIKLADRVNLLQTLYLVPFQQQEQLAREIMEVYAPLADRLGISEVKSNLEDLSFAYLEPEKYQQTIDLANQFLKKAEIDLKQIKKQLLLGLAKGSISAQINTRTKGVYSLYCKLARKEIDHDINKVFDLIALRIIVNNIEDCYAVLGLVHQLFKPLPLGISDFIAQPKPNGYRSIHTKVFAGHRVIEIQIRTEQMHQESEWGVAAHWHYVQMKQGQISDERIEKGFFTPDDKVGWVKELVAWQQEVTDSKELIKSLKLDALKKRIFVFTPQGDVYDLPSGATPVDFAYQIHSALGDSCQGARVDGRWVPLSFRLKSGQTVEVISAKNKKPSADWLKFVITKKARDKLKKITS